jgi:DNA invertase Pin-like site-specific DNA recombinase
MYVETPKFYNYEVLEYDRKSRSDDPLLSVEEVLERHGKILEEYALKYLDGAIPEENKYKEVGSSETIDDRPEMLRLLKAVESPAIKAVMVVDIQRLSRGDLEDAGRLIKILRYSNTYVITPHKIYDLRDEYDRDAFERELKRGNEYLEYFKKIQRRGKLASVKEGNYVGSVAPFGFVRIPIKDKNNKIECWTLAEKKDEADIVRLIFQWYCEDDIGVTAICRRLESMNIKTKNGHSTWKPSIIFGILENVHYIGCVRWNWRKTIRVVEDQEVKKCRPKAKVDEYLVFNGKHDGIVSEELFNKAKEIKGKRHRTKPDTSLKNPFSGLMYCKCGSKIGYNTYTKDGKEYAPPKLVCNNQVHCKSGSADFNEVLTYVCCTLKDCIADFEVRIQNEQDDSAKLHRNLINNLEKKMKDLEAQEVSQWRTQSDPDPDKRMPQHIFKILNEQLLKEKEEVRQALCKAYESIPEPIDYKTRILKFADALAALEDPSVSAKIKNDYLKDIIEKIEYERPAPVRITKENASKYNTTTGKGMKFHVEPYKISIAIKP